MNTKHTPAPWAYAPSHPAKANDTEHVIEMEGGSSPIAIVYSGGVGISHSQAQSNARLIAAAPELLDALVELMKPYNGQIQSADAYKKANSIIAKATGEQA
jgi:hypothetical protein